VLAAAGYNLRVAVPLGLFFYWLTQEPVLVLVLTVVSFATGTTLVAYMFRHPGWLAPPCGSPLDTDLTAEQARGRRAE